MRGYFIGFLSLVFNYMRDLNMLVCKKKKSAMERKRLIVQKKGRGKGWCVDKDGPWGKNRKWEKGSVAHLASLTCIISRCVLDPCQL